MLHRVLTVPALLVSLMIPAGALAQDGQGAAEPRASISPSEGATRTVIQLSVEGLPGHSDVMVLAGPDPERLSPIERGVADAQGELNLQIQVPEEAQRGQPYYFAVDPGGDAAPVLAEPPFQVIVRENAPPGGA